MIYITQDKKGRDVVNITRSDYGALTIPLKNKSTGQAYTMGETEYLTFTVREFPTEDSPILLQSTSALGSNVIEFTHAQTGAMEVGEYSADVQLTTRDDKPITVWPVLEDKDRTSTDNRKNFCITTEVT